MRRLHLLLPLVCGALAWFSADLGFAQHRGQQEPPRWKVDYRRNNCWPMPFLKADRDIVNQPFNTMINKGWQLDNTLGDHHFDPATNSLNRAGEHKVASILLNASPERHTIFVLRRDNPEVSAARMTNVQTFAARLSPDAAVLASQHAPRGWAGDYIDTITKKYEATRPDPVLPEVNLDVGE